VGLAIASMPVRGSGGSGPTGWCHPASSTFERRTQKSRQGRVSRTGSQAGESEVTGCNQIDGSTGLGVAAGVRELMLSFSHPGRPEVARGGVVGLSIEPGKAV